MKSFLRGDACIFGFKYIWQRGLEKVMLIWWCQRTEWSTRFHKVVIYRNFSPQERTECVPRVVFASLRVPQEILRVCLRWGNSRTRPHAIRDWEMSKGVVTNLISRWFYCPKHHSTVFVVIIVVVNSDWSGHEGFTTLLNEFSLLFFAEENDKHFQIIVKIRFVTTPDIWFWLRSHKRDSFLLFPGINRSVLDILHYFG